MEPCTAGKLCTRTCERLNQSENTLLTELSERERQREEGEKGYRDGERDVDREREN